MNELSGVPMVVADRVQRLERRGELTTGSVLLDAEDESSPLHRYFEWDDSAAAHAHRLDQARTLIRRVKVTLLKGPEREPILVNAYVAKRDTNKDAAPGTYVSLARVAGDETAAASLRESMRRDLLRIKRRYENTDLLLDALGEVFPEVSAA